MTDELAGRRIVLGVSGGIAAYKSIELCRLLVDAGAHVIPVLTEAATKFVGPVTFSALASERARVSLYDDPDPIPHTRLGQSADLVVVAPATARVIGAYAQGISDDILTATLLATEAPVVVCPAMHTEMWDQPATQENLEVLKGRGVQVVAPGAGPSGGRRPRQGADGRALGDLRSRHCRTHPEDLDRPEGPGDGRRHPRAHRRGALHRQPVIGETGHGDRG